MVKEVSLFAVLVLSGCGSLPTSTKAAATPPSRAEFCAEANPIIVSPMDKLTTDTARQIAAHDQHGAMLCGWKQ
jgi:hypothetical protein